MFIFLAYPRIVSTYAKSKEELHTEEEDQRYSTLAQSKYILSTYSHLNSLL